MNKLYKYIQESCLKLTDDDKKYLLILDNEYKNLILRVRGEYNEKDIINMDEEFDKFMDAYRKGEKYYPILKTHECKSAESHIVDD
jgi:hypothetical protein